jgi:hypothetical protein
MALPTKRFLAKRIAENFHSERGAKRMLARAVALRAVLVARLRELRNAYTELGEATYLQMKATEEAPLFDAEVSRMRIDGLDEEIQDGLRLLSSWLLRVEEGDG